MLNTSPKVEREGRDVLSFFMLDIFTWKPVTWRSSQNKQASKQAYERCLPHTFHRLALESQPEAWIPGRAGGQNKQASKLLRPLAFGSLSNYQR